MHKLNPFDICSNFVTSARSEEIKSYIENINRDFCIINIINNNFIITETLINLKELDNFLKENLLHYKRDSIIDELLEE